MPKPSDEKRQHILDAAASLFAKHRFHEVLIDDVAAAAGVSKGTVYLYFADKNDLYFSTARAGILTLIEELEKRLAEAKRAPTDDLRVVIEGLAQFSVAHVDICKMVATGKVDTETEEARETRAKVRGLIESVIARGNACGAFNDPQPALTAMMIPGMVLEVVARGSLEIDGTQLSEHVYQLVAKGIIRSQP